MLVVGVQRNRKSTTNLGIFSFSTFLMLAIKVIVLLVFLMTFQMVGGNIATIMRMVQGPKTISDSYNFGKYLSQI